jgi:hypothetical protein
MPRFLLFLLFIPGLLNAQSAPSLVKRNTKAPVEVTGVIIKQDRKTIGFVRLLQQFNNGKPATVYQCFLPNGTQVATAFAYGKDSHDWLISISGDPDISFNVTSRAGADVKDIADVLIRNGYL